MWTSPRQPPSGPELHRARTAMRERIPFYERRKGALLELEDWWRLIIEDDGSSCVEHEWLHVEAYGHGIAHRGKQVIPLKDFWDGDNDGEACESLVVLLAQRRRH